MRRSPYGYSDFVTWELVRDEFIGQGILRPVTIEGLQTEVGEPKFGVVYEVIDDD